MLIRGYETRRTDSFPIQVKALEDIFAKLMARDIDNALESSKNWVTKVSEMYCRTRISFHDCQWNSVC